MSHRAAFVRSYGVYFWTAATPRGADSILPISRPSPTGISHAGTGTELPPPPPLPLPRARSRVVGPGRLGTALAPALRAAGVDGRRPARPRRRPPAADAVLLCVPDAEIARAAAAVRRRRRRSSATPAAPRR